MNNSLNSILIEGNLVREPLLRATSKGTQVCSFTLVSNRFYKQDTGFEREVSFFDVESWAKLAENCYSEGHKGRGVRVVGRLKQDRWNDPEGKPHSRVVVVAEHVEFRPEFHKYEGERESTGEFPANPAQAATAQVAAEAPAPVYAESRVLEEVMF
ncbi:MAG: single-stranded DNA-binding protein [Treponema sp.]|nr:single-stranded DNA-binding protein [Treponema sp.]